MSSGFRARVLVTVDEEFTLNLLRELLERANFKFLVSDNGSISILASGGGLGTALFKTFAKSWLLGQKGSQTVLTFTLSKGEK